MKDDLDELIGRAKVYEYLETQKDSYYNLLIYLIKCWNENYPDEETIDLTVIESWIWEIIRMQKKISTFFFQHPDPYYDEWFRIRYDLTNAPKRIVKRIIKIIKDNHPGEFDNL